MALAADARTLKAAPATLTWQAYDGDGDPRDPGSVTVTVTNMAGTSLVTDAATTGTGTDPRVYSLAAALIPDEDYLTVAWKVSGTTVGTTRVEVVGGYYAQIARLTTVFRGALDWDAAEVKTQRNHAEDSFRQLLGYSCVPRFTEDTIRVRSTSTRLTLTEFYPRAVRYASVIDGTATTALTAGELAALHLSDSGVVERLDGNEWYADTYVRVGYTHGLDAPPNDVAEAFVELWKHRLLALRGGLVSATTTYTTTEGMSVQVPAPGDLNRPTGLENVDRVIVERRLERFGVA